MDMGMPGMGMSTMVSAKSPPLAQPTAASSPKSVAYALKKILNCSRFLDPAVLLWPHRPGLLFHRYPGKYTTSLFCEGSRYCLQYYDSKFRELYYELILELMTS
jgi:hypothetical protein